MNLPNWMYIMIYILTYIISWAIPLLISISNMAKGNMCYSVTQLAFSTWQSLLIHELHKYLIFKNQT